MKPRSIPPVPPPEAVVLLKEEAAGLLRMSTRHLDELRRTALRDCDGNLHPFPAAYVLGGITRWDRAELMEWFKRLPRGWSQMGQRGAA